MSLDARWIRLRAVWLLVIPFLWLARPSPVVMAWGGGLAVLGLTVRSWAAGVIRKGRELSIEGPYAYTRNPLYVGSLLVGVGVTVAGGRWYFVVAFLLFFVLVYGRTILGEAELLEELFGEAYELYARHVPLVVPRVTPWRPPPLAPPDRDGRGRFAVDRWRRNREYEAVAGTVAGFAFLAAKMLWM